MGESKFGEPWMVSESDWSEHPDERWGVRDNGEWWMVNATGDVPKDLGVMYQVDPEARMSHITECVNALAGVDDPAAFVEKTRALVEAVKKIDEIDWAFAHSENMIGEEELSLIADAVEALADHPMGEGER